MLEKECSGTKRRYRERKEKIRVAGALLPVRAPTKVGGQWVKGACAARVKSAAKGRAVCAGVRASARKYGQGSTEKSERVGACGCSAGTVHDKLNLKFKD